jgi:hypothetical protein
MRSSAPKNEPNGFYLRHAQPQQMAKGSFCLLSIFPHLRNNTKTFPVSTTAYFSSGRKEVTLAIFGYFFETIDRDSIRKLVVSHKADQLEQPPWSTFCSPFSVFVGSFSLQMPNRR